MKILKDSEEISARNYLDLAAKEALNSTCLRSRCGSIIVNNNKVIGRGFNSPPQDLESQRRCNNPKEGYSPKVTDKTCCVHAEQRAMFDALKNSPKELTSSKLYFVRLNNEGKVSLSGKPYCTICSKMALDLGIKEFILWQKEGITTYGLEEYNKLSYEFNEP